MYVCTTKTSTTHKFTKNKQTNKIKNKKLYSLVIRSEKYILMNANIMCITKI